MTEALVQANCREEGRIVAVLSMAHSLRLKVVAEGMETVEQLEFLHSIKCDKAQGNLFSQPLTFEEAIKIIKRTCPV